MVVRQSTFSCLLVLVVCCWAIVQVDRRWLRAIRGGSGRVEGMLKLPTPSLTPGLIYTCIREYFYTCLLVSVSINILASVSIHILVYVNTCILVYLYTHILIYLYTHILLTPCRTTRYRPRQRMQCQAAQILSILYVETGPGNDNVEKSHKLSTGTILTKKMTLFKKIVQHLVGLGIMG